MSAGISLIMKATSGAGLAGAAMVAGVFDPRFFTILLSDPVVLLETAAILFLAYYLFRSIRSEQDEAGAPLRLAAASSRTIFPVLTINGVGALISEPKRSLQQR